MVVMRLAILAGMNLFCILGFIFSDKTIKRSDFPLHFPLTRLKVRRPQDRASSMKLHHSDTESYMSRASFWTQFPGIQELMFGIFGKTSRSRLNSNQSPVI